MSKIQIPAFLRVKNFFFLLTAFLLLSPAVSAQKRDHLTSEEIELVRDIQELDKRMEVFVKAIDRRFLVINGDNSQTRQIEKDSKKWGELPEGTRIELLADIKKILQEAIDKIDDVAERDAQNALLPVALHTLADGAQRFLPQFKSLLDTATDKREIGVLQDSIEFCDQIIEAAAKVPREIKKKKKN